MLHHRADERCSHRLTLALLNLANEVPNQPGYAERRVRFQHERFAREELEHTLNPEAFYILKVDRFCSV